MGAQSMVVSFGERLRGLGEHRGGHDSPDPWEGTEDLHVTMLASLAIGVVAAELVEQLIDVPRALGALGAHRRSLGNSSAMCAVAACVVPSATCSAGARSSLTTSSADKRRMRFFLKTLAIRLAVSRRARAGVGAISMSSHSQGSSAEGDKRSTWGK